MKSHSFRLLSFLTFISMWQVPVTQAEDTALVLPYKGNLDVKYEEQGGFHYYKYSFSQILPPTLTRSGNSDADKKVQAKLAADFDAAAEKYAVATYTKSGLDKRLKAIEEKIIGTTESARSELKAVEERITKVIIDSSSTIPAAVLEQLVLQAEEKARIRMRPQIEAMEAKIKELELRLAAKDTLESEAGSPEGEPKKR